MKCKCGSQHWFIGGISKGKAPRICMNCGAYAGEIVAEFELACGMPLELRRDIKESTKYWGLYGKIKRGHNNQRGKYIESLKENILADLKTMSDPEVADKYKIGLSTLRYRRLKWGLPKRRKGDVDWGKNKVLSMP